MSSIFQALVVLVHDMGQNWELISDAVNGIVRFKVIIISDKILSIVLPYLCTCSLNFDFHLMPGF
jgi:hypothetical protein